jgi:hypothetical protein
MAHPVWFTSIVLGLLFVGMGFCILMLHRNKKVLAWRLRANSRWYFHAEMIGGLLVQSSKMWAYRTDLFQQVLKENSKFAPMFHDLPSYEAMMWNFKAWNYEDAVGDYEKRLADQFAVVMNLIKEAEELIEPLRAYYESE